MKHKKEIWSALPGYKGYYEVSNKGDIRSVDRIVNSIFYKGKTLTYYFNKKNKFFYVTLWEKGKGKQRKIWRLISLDLKRNSKLNTFLSQLKTRKKMGIYQNNISTFLRGYHLYSNGRIWKEVN